MDKITVFEVTTYKNSNGLICDTSHQAFEALEINLDCDEHLNDSLFQDILSFINENKNWFDSHERFGFLNHQIIRKKINKNEYDEMGEFDGY